MKLWGSTKKDVDKDEDGEDVPKLESKVLESKCWSPFSSL